MNKEKLSDESNIQAIRISKLHSELVEILEDVKISKVARWIIDSVLLKLKDLQEEQNKLTEKIERD